MSGAAAENYQAAGNPCRQCMPLGASWAFKGIEGCIPVLHGSQGCATYIRRFMISHFREPIDIASSSFDETTVIFGGQENLEQAVMNVFNQYKPEVIGIATTCLSETIGDDVERFVRELRMKEPGLCTLIPVSTPSYQGTQEEGFHRTVFSIVSHLAGADVGSDAGSENEQNDLEEQAESSLPALNFFLPMVTPADIRWIRKVTAAMKGEALILPDISDTLDGGLWNEYNAIPPGGTSVDHVRSMHLSEASMELGALLPDDWRPGYWLQKHYGTPTLSCGLPVGIDGTDHFFKILSEILGSSVPQEILEERNRLCDAYADAHKYLYGKKVVIYGDSSTVESLYRFTSEIGMNPLFCFTGSPGGILKPAIEKLEIPPVADEAPLILEDCDFADAEDIIEDRKPDLLIGNSKGYKISRRTGIPLLRTGFPIHDRFGASRQRMLGYSGALELLDRIVNILMEKKQDDSEVGYTYL
ncbi:MAG: nitrogenase component 1 [Spirochaetales bacterium]|nr:nitrogenase component 1 [Spirochaetales bacterium]